MSDSDASFDDSTKLTAQEIFLLCLARAVIKVGHAQYLDDEPTVRAGLDAMIQTILEGEDHPFHSLDETAKSALRNLKSHFDSLLDNPEVGK